MILFYLIKYIMHFLNIFLYIYIQFLNIIVAFDFAIKIYHKYVEIIWLKNIFISVIKGILPNIYLFTSKNCSFILWTIKFYLHMSRESREYDW